MENLIRSDEPTAAENPKDLSLRNASLGEVVVRHLVGIVGAESAKLWLINQL